MTLQELFAASPGEIDALPIETLAGMKDAADGAMEDAQKVQAILHGALVRRYAAGLNDTGTHHRADGDFDIKITVPKNVAWDQERLADAQATIRNEWEADPAEYIDAKLTVSETKYGAWPAQIRDLLTPARTVKPGKPKFEITLIADAATQRDAA
jgi:hypothetical protein